MESPAPKPKNNGKNSNKNSNKQKKNVKSIHTSLITNIRVKEKSQAQGQGQAHEEEYKVQEPLNPTVIQIQQRKEVKKGNTQRWQVKQRWQALNRDMRWEGHHMHQADQEGSTFRRKIIEKFKFVAHLSKSLWENCNNRMNRLTTAQSLAGNFIGILACHKLTNCLPNSIDVLRGLGLNYCIEP